MQSYAAVTGGSEDGLRRLAAGNAMVAGLHILDQASGDYNIAAVCSGQGLADLVLIEWAKREQGMVVAEGNPLGIAVPGDLAKPRVRLVRRQEGAGAPSLLQHILEAASIRLERLTAMAPPAVTESEVAAAILDGKADAGIVVRAVAHHFRLDFVPLRWERFDLAVRRRDYFEPPVQKLLGFARSGEFAEKAAVLGGYDLARTGSVSYNA